MHLDRTIGRIRTTETLLADACRMLADRYARDPEVREITRVLARWSDAHVHALEPFASTYGEHPSDAAHMLRGALFAGTRVGGLGLLDDIGDLTVLIGDASTQWTTLAQAASELRDQDLLNVCYEAASEVHRARAWAETMLKHTAPQALVVPAPPLKDTRASVARPPSIANLPDAVWSPTALAATLLGWAVVAPPAWLAPGAAASASLQAVAPGQPAARAYNAIASHMIAFAAGTAARRVRGSACPSRAAAGVFAAASTTVLACELLRARHPPAIATAVLVMFEREPDRGQMLYAAGSLMISALTGALLGKVRTGGMKPRRRSLPGGGSTVEPLTEQLHIPVHLRRPKRTKVHAPA